MDLGALADAALLADEGEGGDARPGAEHGAGGDGGGGRDAPPQGPARVEVAQQEGEGQLRVGDEDAVGVLHAAPPRHDQRAGAGAGGGRVVAPRHVGDLAGAGARQRLHAGDLQLPVAEQLAVQEGGDLLQFRHAPPCRAGRSSWHRRA